MSRQGNCYDNAAMESFWSTLKLELIYRTRFTSRRHTSIGGLSPTDFEAKNHKIITPFSLPVFSKQAQ